MIHIEHDSGTIHSISLGKHRIDTLLYHIDVDAAHRQKSPAIVRLHGVLGNLLDETEHFLPSQLARRGYTSINMNTLLANLGLFYGFGVFDDVVPQIDAVCDFLRDAGFEKIVIAGHGLGGCMAIRYAAVRNDTIRWPDLRGVIAVATPYSFPDTTQRRWKRFGSEPTYQEVCQRAGERFAGSSTGNDETILIRKAHGPTRRPEHSEVYTLNTWWHLAGPEAQGAKPYLNIGKIKVPILVVEALRDEILEQREGEDLARTARSAGHEAVSHVEIDADHSFTGRHTELSEALVAWLANLVEP